MTDIPPLALLAGGLATRLRPLTEKIPKSLLSVADEPFLAHQLRLFRHQGIRKVVLCLGHLSEHIAHFAGNGDRFGLEIHYSLDGANPLGTGGALKKALPLLGTEFFVCYGDSYLEIPYSPVVECFRRSGMSGLMTIFRNEGNWDTSNVEFDGRAIRNYKKGSPTPAMDYIDWGLGIFQDNAFNEWPTDEPFDLADVYAQLVKTGKLGWFEVSTRFYEIGSAAGLSETDAFLRRTKNNPGLKNEDKSFF